MNGKEFGMMLLMFLVFGGGVWVVLRPIASALAKRIAREHPPPADAREREATLEELQRLRQEIGELAERMDFAERLLAKPRDAERLAPPQ